MRNGEHKLRDGNGGSRGKDSISDKKTFEHCSCEEISIGNV